MAVFALLFVLVLIVSVVGGILVHMYLYANNVFQEDSIKKRRKPPMGAASFSQMATMSTSAMASDLYYGGIGVKNEDRASLFIRRFILCMLCILCILVALVILTVIMPGATQF